MTDSPKAKIEEAQKHAEKAEQLHSEVYAVLSAEQEEAKRIHDIAVADELKAEEEKAKNEAELQRHLTEIREDCKDFTDEQVEEALKASWEDRTETPKLYRAAMSVYMTERGLR